MDTQDASRIYVSSERVKENIHHMLDHDAAWWWIKQCLVPCQCFFPLSLSRPLFFIPPLIAIAKRIFSFMPIQFMWWWWCICLCMHVFVWAYVYRWFLRSDECWHKVSFVIAISYIVFLKIDIGKLSARLRWSSVCFEFAFASILYTNVYDYYANILLKCRL